MTDELRVAALKLRDHAWLERFRKADHSEHKGYAALSPHAANIIAEYVDGFIERVLAEHPADNDEPLTEEWLRTMQNANEPEELAEIEKRLQSEKLQDLASALLDLEHLDLSPENWELDSRLLLAITKDIRRLIDEVKRLREKYEGINTKGPIA